MPLPDAGTLLLFMTAALALNVTPGPDMLLRRVAAHAAGYWGDVYRLGVTAGLTRAAVSLAARAD